MNKLLLVPLLLITTLSQAVEAAYMEFNNKEVVIYLGEIPDTSVSYDLERDRDDPLWKPYSGNFINTTKMTLSYEGKDLQYLWGWSIRGIPAAYEYWLIDKPGEYLMLLEVEIEHNPDSAPYCNKSSNCYVPSDRSEVVHFTDTLKIIVLPSSDPKEEDKAIPEAPVIIVDETSEVTEVIDPPKSKEPVIETEEVIIDTGETEIVLKEPISTIAEADPINKTTIASSSDTGGLLLWLLSVPLLIRNLRRI